MQALHDAGLIAIDGKALRRLVRKRQGTLYLVATWSSNHSQTLAQAARDQKLDGITAIPEKLNASPASSVPTTGYGSPCNRKSMQRTRDQQSVEKVVYAVHSEAPRIAQPEAVVQFQQSWKCM